MMLTKKVSIAVNKAMKPEKTGLMVEGFEVDHVHIKVFPMERGTFSEYPKHLSPAPSKEEMQEIADKIKKEL